MPHYKLTSFKLQGRAQPIHLLFAQAGVEYENIEVKFTDEAWIAYKPKTPFGQLPVLEVDGKMIAQCGAISDYLAKQFGLNGKDDWEAAKIQELAGGNEDFISSFRTWFIEKDEAKKNEILDNLRNEKIIPFLDRYEKFLTENGTGYFVGNELTQADISIFYWLGFIERKVSPETFKKYTELNKFYNKVAALPKVADWLAKRPKPEM